jgi:hypothetical protein
MGAKAAPRFQDRTGQYECGNAASLMWKLWLICSAALVSIVPFTWTAKVMAQARMQARCFFAAGQLKGFSGSLGVKSMVLFVVAWVSLSPFDAWDLASSLGAWASSCDSSSLEVRGEVERDVWARDAGCSSTSRGDIFFDNGVRSEGDVEKGSNGVHKVATRVWTPTAPRTLWRLRWLPAWREWILVGFLFKASSPKLHQASMVYKRHCGGDVWRTQSFAL